MDTKIQELTDKIYKEGVEKGNEEAGRIIAEANAQKDTIIKDAEAEALLHMYLCLLKRWRMRLCRKECRESRRMNLPRRQFTEVQRWCSIRENIREN